MNDMKAILNDLQDLMQTLKECASMPDYSSLLCGEQPFILLLGGLSSYRKTPGIEGHVGFDRLHVCADESDRQQVRKHVLMMYGVTDADSLWNICERFFCVDRQYRDFLSFWNGTPVFDERELVPKAQSTFHRSMEFAEQFRPLVGNTGFLAWDINERINLTRKAYACGMISEEQFWRKCGDWARQAAGYYASWAEYAMGCLCGAIYFMFRQDSEDIKDLKGFFDIQRQLLGYLFEGNNPVWRQYQWFSYPGKKFAKSAADILPLLNDWDGPAGCLATDRVTVDGCKVEYMYRERPDPNRPDSGWRFFSGDESDEYVNNPDNSGVYHLNTICNYDPDIIPLLRSNCGTAYGRDKNGVFRKEPLQTRE